MGSLWGCDKVLCSESWLTSSIRNLNLLQLIRIYEFYYPGVCHIWKCLIREESDAYDAPNDQ